MGLTCKVELPTRASLIALGMCLDVVSNLIRNNSRFESLGVKERRYPYHAPQDPRFKCFEVLVL